MSEWVIEIVFDELQMKIRWFYLLVNFFLVDLSIAQDIISTVVGTGSSGYSGDNGLATSATLYHPEGLSIDSSGIA